MEGSGVEGSGVSFFPLMQMGHGFDGLNGLRAPTLKLSPAAEAYGEGLGESVRPKPYGGGRLGRIFSWYVKPSNVKGNKHSERDKRKKSV